MIVSLLFPLLFEDYAQEGIFLSIIVLSFNAGYLAAGICLLRDFRFKHYVVFPVSVIGLVNFPFNTALSLYYFWYFIKFEWKK